MSKFQNKYRIESNRLKDFDYKLGYWYFVTICTHNRKNCFGKIENGKAVLNNFGKILETEIIKTQNLGKAVIEKHIIMPNHAHFITIPSGESSLGTIVGQIKSIACKKIRLAGLREFRWQANYYEHIIRNEIELTGIRNYIEINPLKWDIDEYYICT